MENRMKAWLKPCEFTTSENGYVVVIDTAGSAGPKDIIDELAAEGMELKPETVLDVITRYNRKSVELACRGFNVNNGIVLMHPVVKGLCYDRTWNRKRNRLYISIQQGTELRAAIAETTVEIMGEHPDPMALFSITDLSTGNNDGTLTRGFNAELKGTYIKIAGDDATCGVYFRNVETAAETKIETKYIAVNDPSRVMIIVPATMDAGTYELRIATQFSSGNKTLKQPRSVSLPFMVEIG